MIYKTHKKNEHMNITCNLCGETFKNIKIHSKHVKDKHGGFNSLFDKINQNKSPLCDQNNTSIETIEQGSILDNADNDFSPDMDEPCDVEISFQSPKKSIKIFFDRIL